MEIRLDAHVQALTACLARIADLQALTDAASLSSNQVWLAAAAVHAALGAAPARPEMTDARQLDEGAWRRCEPLVAALAVAEREADATLSAATTRRAALQDASSLLGGSAWGTQTAVAAYREALSAAVATADEAGRSLIGALSQRPLASARSGALSRKLGRDESRICRDRETAAGIARQAGVALAGGLEGVSGDLQAGAGISRQQLAAATADRHAELCSAREQLASLCEGLATVPDFVGPASTLPVNEKTGMPAVIDAAANSVGPLAADHGPGLRLAAAHRYPRDLGTWPHGSGYIVSRAAVVSSCQAAWSAGLATWAREAIQDVTSAGGFAAFTGQLDRLPDRWREVLTRAQERADALIEALAALTAGLAEASKLLAAALAEWEALLRPDPEGLSSLGRACIRTISRSVDRTKVPRYVLADLDRLGTGVAELRVPVIAPMKAGKSTLLSALLAADILPSRAQVMTVLPTRVVPEASAASLAPRLVLGDTLVSGHVELLGALARALTSSVIASLAGDPHLQLIAQRVRGDDHVHVAPAHAGDSAITGVLAWLHDTVRLAVHVLPPDAVEMIKEWLPEVIVPVPGFSGAGRLVLIDMPGPGEAAAAPVIKALVSRHLDEAHGLLAVVDYTQLGTKVAVELAQLVAARASNVDPAAVMFAVTKVDQRRPGDPHSELIVSMVRELYPVQAWSGAPVIETQAALSLAAARYLAESSPAALHRFISEAYRVGPPDPLPPTGRIRELAELAAQTGIRELREHIFENINWQVPLMAIRTVTGRLGRLNSYPAALAATASWSAQRSRQLGLANGSN